jgi:hypothetical protein
VTLSPVRMAALSIVVLVVSGCSESVDERRLAALERDPLASVEIPGTEVLGRRTAAGGSFFGQQGAVVDILLEVSGTLSDVAGRYAIAAADAGWSVTVRCRPDAVVLRGAKQFDGFDATLTVTVDRDSANLTLRSHDGDGIDQSDDTVRAPTADCLSGP